MYKNTDTKVHIERCGTYDRAGVYAAVKACFDAFGVLAAARGKRVLIKPNLLTAHGPEKAATTHPELVYAAAALLFEAGAREVVIGDSPGGVFNSAAIKAVYRACGMAKAAQDSGAELNFDFGETTVPAAGKAEIAGEFKIGTYIAGAEMIINIAKLKTHTFMRMTAAVKNLYGAIPGLAKAAYHAKITERERFGKLLCDLCDTIAPDFSIIDGIVGMEGEGPGTGDPKFAGVLIAAENPYAADLAAAAVIGLDKGRIPTVTEGIARGYIPESAQELSIGGAAPSEVAVRFEPPPMMGRSGLLSLLPGKLKAPFKRFVEPYPIVGDECVGCGDCARACPRHVIKIADKRAKIDHSGCIKCYCCHELCKYKAIGLRRMLLIRK